jgi:hypothetical protein
MFSACLRPALHDVVEAYSNKTCLAYGTYEIYQLKAFSPVDLVALGLTSSPITVIPHSKKAFPERMQQISVEFR